MNGNEWWECVSGGNKKNAYIHTDDGQLWKENNIKVVEMALAHLLVEFCFLLSE